jgi:hypothetical protein
MFFRLTIYILILVTLVHVDKITPITIKVDADNNNLIIQVAVQSTIDSLKSKWQASSI